MWNSRNIDATTILRSISSFLRVSAIVSWVFPDCTSEWMGMNFDLMRTQYENTHKRMIEGKCNARILRLNYDLIRKYDWLVFRNSDTLYHYLVVRNSRQQIIRTILRTTAEIVTKWISLVTLTHKFTLSCTCFIYLLLRSTGRLHFLSCVVKLRIFSGWHFMQKCYHEFVY